MLPILIDREARIPNLSVGGSTNREISYIFSISESTVENRANYIDEKLGFQTEYRLSRMLSGRSSFW